MQILFHLIYEIREKYTEIENRIMKMSARKGDSSSNHSHLILQRNIGSDYDKGQRDLAGGLSDWKIPTYQNKINIPLKINTFRIP